MFTFYAVFIRKDATQIE